MTPASVDSVTRTAPMPLLAMRLYPEPGTRYVRVFVWRTKKDMKAAWGRAAIPVRFAGGTWGRRVAYCREVLRWNVSKSGGSRRNPCVAEVHMFHSRIGGEIVAHEMFHATMAWGRRVGFCWSRLGDDDAVNDDEERLAYVHGALCREFVNRAYAAGIYS